MARKVFISFLGTGNYVQTYYQFGKEKPVKPVRFIQEALLDHIQEQFDEDSKIFIFCTEKARKINWKDNGQSLISEEIEKKGLEGILLEKPYGKYVKMVPIEEGFSEDEVWLIFDAVYNELKDGDSVYFDVTHAFRSIPMFSTILFNFAHFTKKIKIEEVFYGAFEKLGFASAVRMLPIEERIAPVIDLSSMIELQNLTSVAANFIDYGKVGKIGDAFDNNEDKSFNRLICKLKADSSKLEEYILLNKADKISEGLFADDINGQIKRLLKNEHTTSAQKEILKQLKAQLGPFKRNGNEMNICAAVEWALKYDMIQQAYTLAEELIITLVCKSLENKSFYNLYEEDEQLKWRNYISRLLAIKPKDVKEKNYQYELSENAVLTGELLNKETIKLLKQSYIRLSNNRNVLCHGKKTDKSLERFKSELKEDFAYLFETSKCL